MADAKKQGTAVTQLAPNRLKFSEHTRNIFTMTPEAGTPIEALVDKGYWAHVAAKFKPGDRIEVLAEDGEYFAELLVQDAGRLYAKVAVLRHVKLDSVEVQESDLVIGDLSIKHRGPHLKWCVLRGKDSLHEGKTKDEALTIMRNLAKTTGQAAA